MAKKKKQETEKEWSHPRDFTYEQVIKSKLSACEGCPMYEKNVRVAPENAAKGTPEVLIVGEAPGLGDRTRPFAGAAGKFIRECFAKHGILNQAVLDNVCKCRNFTVDADGRASLAPAHPDALKQCAKQLLRTIKRYKPKIIITLGDVALNFFIQGRSVRSSMGKFYKTRWGSLLYPIMQPAGILRTGSRVDYDYLMLVLRTMWSRYDYTYEPPALPKAIFVLPPWTDDEIADYKVVSERFVASTKHTLPQTWKETNYVTWKQALKIIRSAKSIVGDFETTGMDAWREDADILSFSFAVNAKEAYVFPVWQRDLRSGVDRERQYKLLFKLMRLCERAPLGFWFHHADYDMLYFAIMFQKLTGQEWVWKCEPKCTLILHAALEPNSYHGLEELLTSVGFDSHKYYLAAHLKEKRAIVEAELAVARSEKRSEYVADLRALVADMKDRKYEYADWWILARYNCIDSALEFLFLRIFRKILQTKPLLRVFWKEHLSHYGLTAHHMQLSGLAPNPPAIEEARLLQQERIDRVEQQLYYNPNVLQLLIEEYGYPVDGKHTADTAEMSQFFKFTSTKQMSMLFFGRVVEKNEEGERVMVKCPSLGVSTKISARRYHGYATDKHVLASIIGADWDEVCATHKWADRIQEGVNEEGEPQYKYELGGRQLMRVYQRLRDKGLAPGRILPKLAPMSARSVAHDLIEHRNANKMLSTYINGLEKLVCPDGLIRDEIKVHGTVTGRWSTFLHTLPRDDPTFKRQLKSRFGDAGCIVGADQSQVEARVFGSLSGDRKLIEIFREGRDLHSEVAAAFEDVDVDAVTKTQRTDGKVIHFSTVYGRSIHSLAMDLVQKRGYLYKDAVPYAERFSQWYFGNFVDLTRWIERLIRDCMRDGVTIASNLQRRKYRKYGVRPRKINMVLLSPFGRELCIPAITSRAELRRLAPNYVTQSAAGDITNIVTTRVDRRLRSEKCETRVVLAIHDAIYTDGPKDEAHFVAEVITEEMLRTDGYESWLQVPLATEIEMGPTLGDLRPYCMVCKTTFSGKQCPNCE